MKYTSLWNAMCAILHIFETQDGWSHSRWLVDVFCIFYNIHTHVIFTTQKMYYAHCYAPYFFHFTKYPEHRSTSICMKWLHSFQWSHSIPLCEWHWKYFQFFAIINNAIINILVFILFLICLGTHAEKNIAIMICENDTLVQF